MKVHNVYFVLLFLNGFLYSCQNFNDINQINEVKLLNEISYSSALIESDLLIYRNQKYRALVFTDNTFNNETIDKIYVHYDYSSKNTNYLDFHANDTIIKLLFSSEFGVNNCIVGTYTNFPLEDYCLQLDSIISFKDGEIYVYNTYYQKRVLSHASTIKQIFILNGIQIVGIINDLGNGEKLILSVQNKRIKNIIRSSQNPTEE